MPHKAYVKGTELIVSIEEVESRDGKYTCINPACNGEMVFVHSIERNAHFRHVKDTCIMTSVEFFENVARKLLKNDIKKLNVITLPTNGKFIKGKITYDSTSFAISEIKENAYAVIDGTKNGYLDLVITTKSNKRIGVRIGRGGIKQSEKMDYIKLARKLNLDFLYWVKAKTLDRHTYEVEGLEWELIHESKQKSPSFTPEPRFIQKDTQKDTPKDTTMATPHNESFQTFDKEFIEKREEIRNITGGWFPRNKNALELYEKYGMKI